MEDGPFAPEAALERGLVDAVGYPDEARDEAKTPRRRGARGHALRREARRAGGGRGVLGVLRALAGSGAAASRTSRSLPAVGSIAMSASPSLLGGSDGITERELGKQIRRAHRRRLGEGGRAAHRLARRLGARVGPRCGSG